MLEAVDYVGHDGACRGQLSGALAVEHNVAGGVAADHYGVEHVVNRGKLAFPADEHRGNNAVYFSVFLHGNLADELYDRIVIRGIGHVHKADF